MLRLLLLALTMVSSARVFARAPNESEFTAAAEIGDQIGHWVDQQQMKAKRVAIISVITGEPLEQDYASILEANILKRLNVLGFEYAASCSECRSPQLNVEGEVLVIRKGMPDSETMKKMADKIPAEGLLTVDVYRTKLYVMAQANLYRNGTAELIGTERFSAPAVSFEDRDVMFLTTFGGGKVVGITESTYSYTANLMLVEELGIGKGGLSIGGVMSTAGGTLIEVNPTFVYTGRFGGTGFRWAGTLGVGFGMNGSAKGITARGSLEAFLGSWSVVGFEYHYFASDATGSAMTGFWGIHIGFSLGR